MDKGTFEASDPYVEQVSDILDRALNSPECGELKRALDEFNKAIGISQNPAWNGSCRPPE